MFVFRNHTIERFFPKDYHFSGYDDVSLVPEQEEGYVWCYQAPIGYDNAAASEEIGTDLQKFLMVLETVNPNKTVIAFTMTVLYSLSFTDEDLRLKEAVGKYNAGLISASLTHKNLKVIDIEEFTSRYPAEDLMDWKFYLLSQMGMNPRLAAVFQQWFAKKLDEIALKRKKCLVLDLDNTLWGGILGEDGPDGIKIGGDYPGKAFLLFQQGLLELSRNGVVLAVCSKNNEQEVLDLWEKNPYLVLRKEHFAAYRINWQDKASNLKELAEELNLGLDSFVFVDDNPTERALVKQLLPMVSVPDFPAQPYELPVFFKKLVEEEFKVYSITEEDKAKTLQYQANAMRSNLQKRFEDFDGFLKSLDMHLTVGAANEYNIPRIAQMTQKTNQFNLTTKRYTDAEIRTMIEKGWKVFCLSVADRFGDSGITGCAIIKGNEMDTFLLSCRILGKGIETAFLKKVLQMLREEGVSELNATYIPTAKNAQVKDFYEGVGMRCVAENENGEKQYKAFLNEMDLFIQEYYHMEIK
ncbi:MAG: HAD-IIIC family phosphatase [Bacteroidales bacterium]|nr:HAD-IIIC family phosphatase [Bacteroidales bacterium]